MVLVIVHPNNSSFIKLPVQRLTKEIDGMMECRLRAVKANAKVPILFPDTKCLLRDD
jgi:hypothetical protein